MSHVITNKFNSFQQKNKALKVTLTAAFVFSLFSSECSANSVARADSIEQLFIKVSALCHAQEFDKSLAVGMQIREEFPDSPVGIFSLIKNYQSIDANYRIRLFEPKVDSLLDIAIDLSEKALKADKKNGRYYFYAGTAYGFKSLFSAQNNEWMEAFKAGTRITRNLNRAVALEPEFYDAYYGLGLNSYWLNAKGPMRFIPNSSANRNKGIQQIKLVIEKGTYSRTDAMFGLAAIYIHEESYDLALELYKRLFQEYPQNPNANYRMGVIYELKENWHEALHSYSTLLGLLENTPYKSYSYKVECLYRLATCNYKLENLIEAKRLCQEAIAIWQLCDFEKELEGPYKSFSEILNGLNNLSDELKDINISQVSETN